MISRPLLKQTIRSNYKILLIFIGVLSLYTVLIVGMYNPNIDAQMHDLSNTLSPELISAFGFSMETNTLMNFLASYLYGFLAIAFPMIYEIIVSNRLIAKHVDRGSMAVLLASPTKRVKIAITQAFYLLVSLAILIGVFAALGIIVSEMMFPNQLDIPHYLLMNLGVYLLHVMISGIGFSASCVYDETKLSLAIGAGLPIGFFLLQMLASMGGRLEILKYFTVFSLFDTKRLIIGSSDGIVMAIILGVAGVVLYAVGIFSFSKRDLPI